MLVCPTSEKVHSISFPFNIESIAKRKEEKIGEEKWRGGDPCCRSSVFVVLVVIARSVIVLLFLLCYYSSLSLSHSLYFLHVFLL